MINMATKNTNDIKIKIMQNEITTSFMLKSAAWTRPLTPLDVNIKQIVSKKLANEQLYIIEHGVDLGVDFLVGIKILSKCVKLLLWLLKSV